MDIKPGTILISSTSLDDHNFDRVVIFITEYNEQGAMGFVFNKLFPRTFNELAEFKNSKSFPLYEGGPVENESLFFLHCQPNLIEDGTLIVDSIYLGGDFMQAVAKINEGILNESGIKLFIGYCGWDPGQLEEEVQEGSWLISDTKPQTVFIHPIGTLWENIYQLNKKLL